MSTEVHTDPIQRFEEWFQEAKTKNDPCLDMMTLATASPKGVPSARIVLLKGVTAGQFVFFTNYGSHKAAELTQNPHAALVFHWPFLAKQVRITGTIRKTTREESEAYFRTRPRGSQIGAWASQQSSAIESRQDLEERFDEVEKRFSGQAVPCPEYWGGFALKPSQIEFWIGQESRLHDRFLYTLTATDQWKVQRLSP